MHLKMSASCDLNANFKSERFSAIALDILLLKHGFLSLSTSELHLRCLE